MVSVKKLKWPERLRISLVGDDATRFYTKSGLLLAIRYTRVVIGGRGPYIEFEDRQIIHGNIHIPDDQEYRLMDKRIHYHEHRSNDKSNVKLYFQKKEVAYADYKVGKWYIAPDLLKTDDLDELVLPAYPDPPEPVETLFSL